MLHFGKNGICIGLVLLAWICSGFQTGLAADTPASRKAKLLAMNSPGVDGGATPVFTPNSQGVTVYCFLGSECPLAKLYGPRLQQMSDQFSQANDSDNALPVRFVGVNSNLQDSLEDVASYIDAHGIEFEFVKDYDHRLANLLSAERTPEVVVVDATGAIRYRGRIDDQYQPGTIKDKPDTHDLKTALEELTARKPVTTPETKPVGCVIGRAFEGEVTTSLTYCKDISRLLQKHCVECHRPREIGPFSLTDYEEVIGWGEMSLEVVQQGRMPPWHANPAHGDFANARGMTDNEKQMLREWVEGGMPFGDIAELPKPKQYLEGWQLSREPDVVLNMSEQPFQVAAEGVIEYQYFVVDPGFKEDKWMTGAQVLPGNRSVVHHCIVFVRPPDGVKLQGMGWVAAYVPGQRSTMLPTGYGRKIPAGSSLVFQMHYTPTGTAQTDITKLGLLFGDEADIAQEVFTLPIVNQKFEIPPHAENFAVSGATTRIPENANMLALSPHMHYRGKSFSATAKRGDQETILLDVPVYDFNWQHVYELNEPLSLADIDELSFTSHFDNSANNPFNPDPTAFVTWGDQTWEEMAIAFFEIAIPKGSTIRMKKSAESADVVPEGPTPQQLANLQAEQDKFVDAFFARFDTDQNGVVIREEMPLAQKRYGFKTLDRNGDGQLDRDEIAQQYRSRR